MSRLGRLLTIIFSLVPSFFCCDLANPAVFEPHFYLNTHWDLEHAGLHTPELAADHWCTKGIKEGRQATSSFHTMQYLANYPDLLDMYSYTVPLSPSSLQLRRYSGEVAR